MLVLKAWLETRWKLLYSLALVLAMLGLRHSGGPAPADSLQKGMPVVAFMAIFAGMFSAGAGIATQPAFRDVKGLYGSVYFTLSLPVTRFRLFAVRVGVGLLEFAGVNVVTYGLAWLLFPGLRGNSSVFELLEWIVVVSACTLCFYFVSVFFSTFLEQTGQIFGGTLMLLLVGFLEARFHLGLLNFTNATSLLTTHHLPWASMTFSIGMSVLLCFAALKIAQAREY